MKNKKTKHKNFDKFVNEQLTKDPLLVDELLKQALQEYQKDGDEKALLITLKQVTLAKCGFQELANKTGLSRESLYKTLSSEGNPRMSTLKKILEALDYRLYFQHI
jgi:probable addiction module antidote protein